MSLTRLISLGLLGVAAVAACNGGEVTSGMPLTIASVSPASGKLAGGDVVTITGTGFDAEPTVTFGGTSATSVSFVSPSRIDAVVPPHLAGSVAVVVRNASGQSATLENGYTYAPPPVVTSVMPAESRGGGGTLVTVYGAGFVAGATVSFGGVTASSVMAGDGSRSVRVYTPNHPPGVATIVVTNPDQQSGRLENGITFRAYTTLVRVTPNAGSTAGGLSVVIEGTGFYDANWVWFGNVPATDVTFVSSIRLIATVPARAVGGAVDVHLGDFWIDWYDVTLVNGFTYVSPLPVITEVTPRDGQAEGYNALRDLRVTSVTPSAGSTGVSPVLTNLSIAPKRSPAGRRR